MNLFGITFMLYFLKLSYGSRPLILTIVLFAHVYSKNKNKKIVNAIQNTINYEL